MEYATCHLYFLGIHTHLKARGGGGLAYETDGDARRKF